MSDSTENNRTFNQIPYIRQKHVFFAWGGSNIVCDTDFSTQHTQDNLILIFNTLVSNSW